MSEPEDGEITTPPQGPDFNQDIPFPNLVEPDAGTPIERNFADETERLYVEGTGVAHPDGTSSDEDTAPWHELRIDPELRGMKLNYSQHVHQHHDEGNAGQLLDRWRRLDQVTRPKKGKGPRTEGTPPTSGEASYNCWTHKKSRVNPVAPLAQRLSKPVPKPPQQATEAKLKPMEGKAGQKFVVTRACNPAKDIVTGKARSSLNHLHRLRAKPRTMALSVKSVSMRR